MLPWPTVLPECGCSNADEGQLIRSYYFYFMGVALATHSFPCPVPSVGLTYKALNCLGPGYLIGHLLCCHPRALHSAGEAFLVVPPAREVQLVGFGGRFPLSLGPSPVEVPSTRGIPSL